MIQSGPRWLSTAVYVLVLTAALMAGLHKVAESDSFWHLKTGAWIAENLRVPRTDPFGVTGDALPWIDWEWLFQWGAHVVYAAGGFAGLVTVKALVVAGTAMVVMASCRKAGAGACVSALAAMAALVVARDRMEMRPDVMMFLFAAIMVLALERARTGDRRWLWGMPVVQVLWVNMHPSFPLGICLVGAWFVGCAVDGLVDHFFGERDAASGPLRWRLVGILGVVTVSVGVVTLVNPYGWSLVRHAVEQLRASGPAGVIGEWQPTRRLLLTEPSLSWGMFWWVYWLAPVALAGRLAVEGRRFPWSHALVLAGLSVLAMRAQRFPALYALVTAPVLAGGLAVSGRWLAGRLTGVLSRPAVWVGRWVTMATGCWLIWAIGSERWAMAENRPARFGVGVDELTVPARAVDVLRQLPVDGGLFNTYLAGGYLIWRLHPDRAVQQRWAFADSRANLFGRDYLERYLRAMRDPRQWEDWMRADGVSVVFMQYGPTDDRVLMEHLAGSDDWRLVYFDHAACVYARRASWDRWMQSGEPLPATVSLDDREAVMVYAHRLADEMAGADDYNRGRVLATVGNFLMVSGKSEAAQELFAEAVRLNPRISEAWMNRAVHALEAGRWQEAMEMTNRLLAVNKRYYMAWLMQAQIRMHLRDLDGALSNVQQALQLAPRSAQALVVRAQVAVVQRQEGRAIQFLQRAIAEQAGDATVYWFLAQLLVKQGRNREAVLAYRECLRLWVGDGDDLIKVRAELEQLEKALPAS